MNDETPAEPTRRCPVCGEPIYSRAKVHLECAQREPAFGESSPKKAPQKECQQCGNKTHVRTLVCPACGAMF